LPIDPQTGEWQIEDRDLAGGWRQDMSFSDLRYTAFRNVHVFRRRAISKRNGYKALNTTEITGAPDMLGGLDAHFADGTQKVLAVAGTDAYLFNNTTLVFTAQSLSLAASAQAEMLMFSDYAILANGTQFKKMNASGTWTNVGGSPGVPKYLAVHNNRLISAGITGKAHLFEYSAVRDPDTRDTTNDYVLVTVPLGEVCTGINSFGDDLIYFTRHNTILQWQNPNNKSDWDRLDVSNQIGCVAPKSYAEVSHLPFPMAVFWSEEGPYVIYRLGNEKPVIRSLWEFVQEAIRGETINPNAPGFSEGRFEDIVTSYQPKIQEVRFGLSLIGAGDNNALLCFDLQSLVAFIAGNKEAPDISLKDNGQTSIYPCDQLMPIRTDSSTLLPSTIGVNHLYGMRDGYLYRLDEGFTDNGEAIYYYTRRSGYSGAEEGIGELEKVVTNVRVSGTQNTDYSMEVQVSADGDQAIGSGTFDLDARLGKWGDGGVWTSDPSLGSWNGAVVASSRADLGVRGKVFEVSMYDQGAINKKFEMDRIVLEGQLYERQ
jgi:hypothetical protein